MGPSMRVRFLPALLVAAACGGSDAASTVTPPGSKNKTVDIYTITYSFVESFVTLAAGDTVRWHFATAPDSLGHNVRFNPRVAGAPADLGSAKNPLASGTQLSVFDTKGDFHYICDLHGSMTGEIVVQ